MGRDSECECSSIDARATGDEPGVRGDAILELDHVYAALDHPRRRYLCYTLHEDTEWSLSEIATKISAWERDVPEHAVTDAQREEVYVSLYHVHVPKLVELEVVDFEWAAETVTTAANADQVLAALEGMETSVDARQETHAGRNR